MPTPLLSLGLGAALGRVAWPLLEYGVHGGLCHMMDTPAARFHAGHHQDPRAVFTSPSLWVPSAGIIALGASALAGPALGLGFTGGLVAGFVAYEHQHWRFHFRAPVGERERRRRAHHLAHHRIDGRQYHGVTTDAWDRIFGTRPQDAELAYGRVVDTPALEGRSNFWALYGWGGRG